MRIMKNQETEIRRDLEDIKKTIKETEKKIEDYK